MTQWLVSLDGKLIYKADEGNSEDGKIYVYEPPLFEPNFTIPEIGFTPPAPIDLEVVTTSNLFVMNPMDMAGHQSIGGIFVTPDESYVYLHFDQDPNFYVYDAAGTRVMVSEPIPGLIPSINPALQPGKLRPTRDFQHILTVIDNHTIAKHTIGGEYVTHYTYNEQYFGGTSVAEDADGNIYFGGSSGEYENSHFNGIIKLDSNLNFIEKFFVSYNYKTISTTGMDIDTVNNKIYWASHLQTQRIAAGDFATHYPVMRSDLDGSNVEWVAASNYWRWMDVRLSIDLSLVYCKQYASTMSAENAGEITETPNYYKQILGLPDGYAIDVNPNGSAIYVANGSSTYGSYWVKKLT